MSIRPSALYRNVAQTALPTDLNYVVVGDTSLAVIYADKLLREIKRLNSSSKVYLLTSGNNQMPNTGVEALDYIMVNNRTIQKGLKNQRLHLIVSADEITNSALDRRDILYEEYFLYASGAGPLGDMITAYYIPVCGPWFTSDSKGQLEVFVKDSTIQKALTQNEMIAATNISNLLGLAMTQSIVATRPSILTVNHIFVYYEQSKLERQIYIDGFIDLTNNRDIVKVVTGVNNIFIAPETSCLNTVTYTTLKNIPKDQNSTPLSPTVVNNACVLWMDNLYDYVTTLGLSDVVHKKVQVPVFYRIVFPIPKVNPATGIDLSNLNQLEYPLNIGNISTRLTFCCTDVADAGDANNNNTPTWNFSIYTSDEDFSNTNAGGTYANTGDGKTLLIIEGISLTNRRTVRWDDINASVSVNLNPNAIELGRYNAFLLIAANVYMAYTGSPPPLPIGAQSICTVDGLCTDSTSISHASSHESPMISVIRMLTSLYGGTTYPTPSTNQGPSCCG